MTVMEIDKSLKTIALGSGTKYIDILRRFFEDEFFRRLDSSRFNDDLILRGGFLVWQLSELEGIPSRDLDFLLLTDGEVTENNIDEIISSIINSDSKYDYINYEHEPSKALNANRQYRGFSVNLTGVMENLRVSFRVNIGLGDSLFHQPERLEIPATVSGFSDPAINVYPVESVVAEKLDILLRRFGLNDCMKHLYDVYLLSQLFDFDGYELQRAMAETFETRNNDSGVDAFSRLAVFAEDEYTKQLWRHFGRINNIDAGIEAVIKRVIRFAEPVWDTIAHEGHWQKSWSGTAGEWDNEIYLY